MDTPAPESQISDSPVRKLLDQQLEELGFLIANALDHQIRLEAESKILLAKSSTVGEYRVKLMDYRDRLRDQIKKLPAPKV